MDVNVKKNLGLNKGFTLIEILVVIGIIAILAAVVLIAINPARQFAQARNSQRVSNLNSILNAVGQNMADNKGIFNCDVISPQDTIPTTPSEISETTFDIRECIVPTYMAEVPVDPKIGSINCSNAACDGTGSETYNTKYEIERNLTTQRIKVCAPESANELALGPSPTEICVER